MPAVDSMTQRICSCRLAQSLVMVFRSLSKSACISENFSTIAWTRCLKRGPVKYR